MPVADARTISECRVCGSQSLKTVLDLGTHAISDFVEPGGLPDYAPLVLVRCDNCTLVQLLHTVDRERLYRRYWYRSGTNESMVAALRDVVLDPGIKAVLQPGDRWLDIGANDGTLLRLVGSEYPGIKRTGVEPSGTFLMNPGWEMKTGDCRLHSFFPPSDWVEPVQCKVITSIAMFYDLDKPNEFVDAIKKWLHPDGVWVIQMASLGQMLDANAFDNICHEHLEYYSLGSLQALLARHDLRIASFSANDTNGGSLRVIVKHGARPAPWSEFPYLGKERDLADFAGNVRKLRRETNELLSVIRVSSESVIGYGASTKGNTLLQYYGIDSFLLPAIADRNPDKCGQLTVGSNIPIISEDEMRLMKPDYLFVLPWHFMESFVNRESEFLARGGRFIVPLPTLRVVGQREVAHV